jgi:Putative adhesin
LPTFETREPISVTLEITVGDVHVIATDRLDTVVAVNPRDLSRRLDVESAEQTQVDYSSGSLLVKGPKPRGLGGYIGLGGKVGSIDVTIELPANSRVQTDLGFGDFRGDGRLGDVRIKSGAGSISLDQAAQVQLDTGAGNVTVERVTGRAEVTGAGTMHLGSIRGSAEIKNLNGKTWLGEVQGSLRVKAANGDITVGRAHSDVSVKTSNGSIQIDEVISGSVVLETGSGGLDAGIRSGTTAWVDATTRFGRVHNTLDPTDGPEGSNATVEIRAHSAFGDITIHRSRGET